jgi:hypothetical protein
MQVIDQGALRSTTIVSGVTFNLTNVNGVVAWSSSSGTFFEVYDPLRGNWFAASVGSVLPTDLRNTNGVVAWSKGNFVYSYIYDPTRGGWQGTSFNNGGTINDLRNHNGVVAWSFSPQVRFQVYDPARGRWTGSNVNSGATFDLMWRTRPSPEASSVSTRAVTIQAMASDGRPPAVGLFPFHHLNAPLPVVHRHVLWRSVAGLGNGSATGRRSFTYLYETFGPYRSRRPSPAPLVSRLHEPLHRHRHHAAGRHGSSTLTRSLFTTRVGRPA